jgi:hypothetical protein
MEIDRMGDIERWSAVAATLVDLAKRDLPPHISEAEQVEAYLGLKRIAADYRGAVEALTQIKDRCDRIVAGEFGGLDAAGDMSRIVARALNQLGGQ